MKPIFAALAVLLVTAGFAISETEGGSKPIREKDSPERSADGGIEPIRSDDKSERTTGRGVVEPIRSEDDVE